MKDKILIFLKSKDIAWQAWTLFAGSILAFTPLQWLAFIGAIAVAARLLPIAWGTIGRIVCSYLLYAALISCVAGACWLLSVPVSATLFIIVGNIVLLGLLVLQRRAVPTALRERRNIINTDDLIAVAVTAVILFIVAIPITTRPSFNTIAPLVSAGGDNNAHLNIIKGVYKNQGYAIGENNDFNLRGILVAYPQGWHINVAFMQWMTESVVPVTTSPTKIIAIFYAAAMLWLGAFVFLITRIALDIYARIRGATKDTRLWQKLLIASGVLVGACGWLLSLMAYGFPTQIAALTFLLLQLFFIAQSYAAKTVNMRYIYLLLAGFALAASNFSWLFLLPVTGILMGAALLHTWAQTKKLPLWFIGLFGVAAVFILYQPAVQLLVKVPAYNEGVSVVNQRGNVAIHDILGLIIVVGASLLILMRHIKDVYLRWIFTGIIAALVFSLGLMQHQLATVEELRYYYYKSLFTLIVFATIIGSVALAQMFDAFALDAKKAKAWQKFGAGALSMGIMAAVFVTSISPSYTAYVTRQLNGVSISQANEIATIIANNQLDAYRILPIGSCNRGDDIRASQLAVTLTYQNETKSFSGFELSPLDESVLFTSIKEFVHREKFNLIVISGDQVVSQKLRAYLGEDIQYVKIIDLDTTPETEPVTQCPDRIRNTALDPVKP